MVGICPSVTHERDASVVSLAPEGEQLSVQPLAGVLQEPVPQRVVARPSIAFTIFSQALREAASAGAPAHETVLHTHRLPSAVLQTRLRLDKHGRDRSF